MFGRVMVRAGREFGLPPSTGSVTPTTPGTDFPATSFFGVFVEIEVGGMLLRNEEPFRVQTDIGALPPYGRTSITPVTQEPVRATMRASAERPMADPERIKQRFERNAKAVKLRPAIGKYTSSTKIKVRDGLTCEIEEGSWKLVADLDDSSGGEGQGPTPGVYGRAALGSCLAIASAQWAATLGVPIEDLEVDVETDADAAGAYGVADLPAGYTQVRCTITVRSAAPEDEIRRMLDVATERCLYWDVFKRAIDVRREVRILVD